MTNDRFGHDTGLGYNRQFRYEERDDYGVVRGRSVLLVITHDFLNIIHSDTVTMTSTAS